LILITTNIFIIHSASAESRSIEREARSETSLQAITPSLTSKDWKQFADASNPPFSQQAYLKASNANEYDYLGYSVAISGDTAVIGARGEDSDGSGEGDNSALDAGAAYVFVRGGSIWTQQAYLKTSNADSEDFFGWPVAISGDTVVVGTISEDGNGSGGEGNNSATDAGAAYVFVRGGSTWSQQAYLKASNAEAYDYFGYGGVAISGETVVVGAPYEDSDGSGEENNDAEYAGAVYVFADFKNYLPLFTR
jgi:hypothetical protein